MIYLLRNSDRSYFDAKIYLLVVCDNVPENELYTNIVEHIYSVSDGVGAARVGNMVQFRINQTSSYLKTTLKNLYALALKKGYRPAARVSALCLLWNSASGDQKFYIGCISIDTAGKITCNRQEWGGGVTAISDGGTYYVWSLNMTYRTDDPMPTD